MKEKQKDNNSNNKRKSVLFMSFNIKVIRNENYVYNILSWNPSGLTRPAVWVWGERLRAWVHSWKYWVTTQVSGIKLPCAGSFWIGTGKSHESCKSGSIGMIQWLILHWCPSLNFNIGKKVVVEDCLYRSIFLSTKLSQRQFNSKFVICAPDSGDG